MSLQRDLGINLGPRPCLPKTVVYLHRHFGQSYTKQASKLYVDLDVLILVKIIATFVLSMTSIAH